MYLSKSLFQCVQWHPNCNYIATGSSDKTVRLWDVQTGECVRIFIGHRSMVLSLAMSPDGRYMASGDEDGTIMMWDLSTARCITPLMGHNSCVWSLSYRWDSEISRKLFSFITQLGRILVIGCGEWYRVAGLGWHSEPANCTSNDPRTTNLFFFSVTAARGLFWLLDLRTAQWNCGTSPQVPNWPRPRKSEFTPS